MHNNFYFLKQISQSLEEKILGYKLISCFSQNKNELILELLGAGDSFFIRINTLPELSCISFPAEFSRTKKNSVDLFKEIIGKEVTSIVQFENDRSFCISFGELNLAILLHGVRSNIILFNGQEPEVFFNKKLSRGFNVKLDELNSPLSFTFQSYEESGYNIKKTIPTFDQTVLGYLESKSFSDLPPYEQWRAVEELLSYLQKPSYYLTIYKNKPLLSLLEIGEVKEKLTDPIQAANAYFQFFNTTHYFQNTKSKLVKEYELELNRTKSYIAKNSEKLEQLKNNNQYEEYANILMANLNSVKTGSKSASLYDFFNNKDVTIPLKEGLSPQKNAELYYKKGKNKKLEISNLEESISYKENRLKQMEEEFEKLLAVKSGKDLKIFIKTAQIKKSSSVDEEILPYKKTEFDGFTVLIGKNAKSNDELLQKFSHKDDLWLHAKDVTGSHVILKYKSESNFPAYVIERAAEIAAFNSKRKTDNHCPVIYTPRKFVRKQKGMAPGAVIVDKEKIIIVTPKGF